MATPPHLATVSEDLCLVAAIDGSRRALRLSARAGALLVDDLGYGQADLVPFVTARALLLAGGATLPDGRSPRETAVGLSGAEGGASADDHELYRVAEYLRAVEVDERTVEMLREHVAGTGLSRFLADGEIRSSGGRVVDLSDIARDL